MDMDNLASGPDIDNLELDKMDRGDSLVSPEAEKAEPEHDDKVGDVFPDKVDDKAAAESEEVDEEDDEKVEEKPRDDKGRFEAKIPKSRFDEAVGKEREAREAAEKRAAELERKLQAGEREAVRTEQIEAIEASIAAMEEKHAELLLDGNGKDAAKVMKEIRMAERQIATAEAESRASAQINQRLEAQKFDTVVARIEADHPQFNPESESYDADLVELVLSKQNALMRVEGLTPSQAMDNAAKYVAERFLKQAEQVKEEPKGLGKKQVEDRKEEQVRKNLETQKRQPASMKESGIDSDKAGKTSDIDIGNLTVDEFAALPEATKAKLRGDYIG